MLYICQLRLASAKQSIYKWYIFFCLRVRVLVRPPSGDSLTAPHPPLFPPLPKKKQSSFLCVTAVAAVFVSVTVVFVIVIVVAGFVVIGIVVAAVVVVGIVGRIVVVVVLVIVVVVIWYLLLRRLLHSSHSSD